MYQFINNRCNQLPGKITCYMVDRTTQQIFFIRIVVSDIGDLVFNKVFGSRLFLSHSMTTATPFPALVALSEAAFSLLSDH